MLNLISKYKSYILKLLIMCSLLACIVYIKIDYETKLDNIKKQYDKEISSIYLELMSRDRIINSSLLNIQDKLNKIIDTKQKQSSKTK